MVARTLRFTGREDRPAVVLAAALLCSLLAHIAPAAAGDMQPAPAQAGESRGLYSVLDGRWFAGEIGPLGKPAFTEDVWEFREGMFASEECKKRCGYPRAPYWVRFEEDGVRFMAEMRCPKTDATIVWRGIVKDGEISGTFLWTRERWYWTIEKEFWFRGKLLDPEVAMTR